MPSTCEATVFYDDAGEASARIYALAAPTIDGRLLTVDELAECRLMCRVEGPKCRYSTTLPTRVKLTHRGVTNWGDLPALVAEAYLPDPCPWSPELPFLYRVIGNVYLGERLIAEIDQTFGVRPMSVVRNRIKFQGKTWVPRGVTLDCTERPPLETWRESSTMIIVDDSSFELLDEAGRVGVSVNVLLEGGTPDLARKAAELSRLPAVALITVEANCDPSVIASARNTLFMSERTPEARNCTQVQYQLFEGAGAGPDWPTDITVPLIAFRDIGVSVQFEEARRLCDVLQRDLAGRGDPAGYFV